MNFDNVDFSNPATIPLILLLTVACQNEELTENFIRKEKQRISKQSEKKTCVGCKHLFYYNDGSVDCDYPRSVAETCLHSDDRYLYDKENVTKSILSNNTK